MSYKIWVTVKAKCKKAALQRLENGAYLAKIKAQPREGKANEELVHALAEYLCVPKSAVRIIHGRASRRKLIEIG